MAKRKTTAGFKTKSKKNKKSRKVKSKKYKEERRKAQKIEMGLKDICSALTQLQVDATVSEKEVYSVPQDEVHNFTKRNVGDRKTKKHKCCKVEPNISRLLQKLSFGGESSTLKNSEFQAQGNSNNNGRNHAQASENVDDEDYAELVKSALSVNIVPYKKLATEAPSGKGATFMQNQLDNDRSYKGRIGKKEFKSKRHKKAKKNKGKGKTSLFLYECGLDV